MAMDTICPFCKEELHLELTGQFVERVDPAILDMYKANLENQARMAKNMGGFLGGMMGMGAKMAMGMQDWMLKQAKFMLDFPPLVTTVRCMRCKSALDTTTVGYGFGSSRD